MNFIIQKSDLSDLDAILDLIQSVYQAIPAKQKEWFAADNAEFTRGILTTRAGEAYTAYEKETGSLAGVFLTAYPGNSPENLGLDLKLPPSDLKLVAHMDSAVISPNYRGYHLQARLMSIAEQDLRNAGYRYLCCTIHPDNCYSMNSALSLGYKKATICEKYGGYLRAVMYKDLLSDVFHSPISS